MCVVCRCVSLCVEGAPPSTPFLSRSTRAFASAATPPQTSGLWELLLWASWVALRSWQRGRRDSDGLYGMSFADESLDSVTFRALVARLCAIQLGVAVVGWVWGC